MKPLDFPRLRECARYPEVRPQVEALLASTRTGLEKALANRAYLQGEMLSATGAVDRWQADHDRLEEILRDTATERAL